MKSMKELLDQAYQLYQEAYGEDCDYEPDVLLATLADFDSDGSPDCWTELIPMKLQRIWTELSGLARLTAFMQACEQVVEHDSAIADDYDIFNSDDDLGEDDEDHYVGLIS